MRAIILLSLMTLAPLSASAQKVYKWVDENGQIHYSSKKPQNVDSETMRLKVPKPKPEEQAATDQTAAEATTDAADEQAAEAEATKMLAQVDRENYAKLCTQAKANLNALNSSPRVQQVDESTGQTRRMNDDERVQALKNALDGVRRYCR